LLGTFASCFRNMVVFSFLFSLCLFQLFFTFFFLNQDNPDSENELKEFLFVEFL
jgi:hypothetical protein